MSNFKVSVAVITYGHEKYIRKAIESVLMQETDFDYEIVIGEDCSPDGTKQILLEYKNMYPQKFNLIFHEENVGASRNLYEVFYASKGKYIAILEGDDYWIDSKKLQKQVDFLDNKSEYFAVSHVIESRDSITDRCIGRHPDISVRGKEISMALFLNLKYYSGTSTMFRNVVKLHHEEFSIMFRAHRFVADFTYCLLFLELGRVFVLDDCMSVYRVRTTVKNDNNYNSQKTTLDMYDDHVSLINNIDDYTKKRYDFSKTYAYHTRNAIIYSIRKKMFTRFKVIFKTIPREYQSKIVVMVFIQLLKSILRRKF